jgi:phosphatidylinositol alpha-1,6-mannosyltransferase
VAYVRPLLTCVDPRPYVVRQLADMRRLGSLLMAVTRLARRHRATAVCVCDNNINGWIVLFARYVLGLRALVYCHGDDLLEHDPRDVRTQRRWFRHAHRVVAAGEFAARRLQEYYAVPNERLLVITNGVDIERFRRVAPDPALRTLHGLDGRRVIVAASRLVPRKGVDRLIEALPEIVASYPDATLLIVGDGEQRAALETMASGLPVRFVGAVPPDDIPRYFALAEMMVLPNRAQPGEVDGLQLVFLEAQACGLPVIGGEAGGTPEAIRDGETGLLVDGTDPHAIAVAVKRLLDDPTLAARLAMAGKAAAAQRGWAPRTKLFLDACRG